jgi:hypothetical protein
MIMKRLRSAGVYGAAVALVFLPAAHQAFAQGNPSACIAQINGEFGSNAALNADCSSENDCTFLAAPGNTQAQTVIASIVQKTETCLIAAGQQAQGEQMEGGSTMRQFDGNGDTRCALLMSKPGTDAPEGVRVLCQKK